MVFFTTVAASVECHSCDHVTAFSASGIDCATVDSYGIRTIAATQVFKQPEIMANTMATRLSDDADSNAPEREALNYFRRYAWL